MAEHLVFFLGNLDPAITETITDDTGAAHNLTGQTVKFKMRPVGSVSATYTVDAAAVVVSAAAGTVRYDWVAADVTAIGATGGLFLCWWEVTTTANSHKQDMAEAVIEWRAHSAGSPPSYVELEQLKSTSETTGFTFADQDGLLALAAASRACDKMTGRRFYLDVDATQVRYYTANGTRRLIIDDLVTLTTLKVDRTGDGVYEETWTVGTDFVLEPLNAAADTRPYENILIRKNRGLYWPCEVEKGVEVTGKFGWLTVPSDIKTATTLIAARLVKRMREAPFGVVALGVDGTAVRIARTDPDVAMLLEDFDRRAPFV